MTYKKLNLIEMEKSELIELIQRIDSRIPVSDGSCDEPGITFSEAIYREMQDDKPITPAMQAEEIAKR